MEDKDLMLILFSLATFVFGLVLGFILQRARIRSQYQLYKIPKQLKYKRWFGTKE